MGLFKKNRREVQPSTPNELPEPTLDLSATTRDRIEIQLAKDASAEAKEKTKKVNAYVNELLDQNGFHVKIYIAAGGTPKRGHK